MKKKLMMVTLLLAGLSMGACVDDKESASVTAVRDAKTEQLESVAAMNSAAAEAKQAIAAAEAALKLAEAQAKQAAADLKNAEAEYQKKQTELNALKNEAQSIENQKKQAELEAQLAQLEVDKKRIEKQMAQIKADMEKAQVEAQAALLRAEAAMKDAEQQLLDYEKQLADAKTQAEKDRIEAERTELEQLAYTYSNAVTLLNLYKNDLIQLKSNLVLAENNLSTMKDGKEALIVDNTNAITQLQIEIDALKKYANYTEDIEALKLQYTILSQKMWQAYDVSQAANSAYLNLTVNTEASDALQDEVDNNVLYRYTQYALVDENGDPYLKSDGSAISAHGYASYIKKNPGRKTLWYTYEEGDYITMNSFGDSIYIDLSVADLRQFELDIEPQLANYKTQLENATKNATKLQRLYNGTPTEADWENGGSATKNCANMVDSTAILKAAYDKATEAAAKAAAKTAYETQLAKEQQCKRDLDAAINQQADAQLESDCFNKEVDLLRNFDSHNAALQAKIKARNEQVVKEYEEKVALWFDSEKKALAYQIAAEEWNVLDDILYYNNGQTGAMSIANQIAQKEREIADKKAEIEDISAITTQEQLVEKCKAKIEIAELKVKMQEIAVQNAKADLEAAMAKYAATEE